MLFDKKSYNILVKRALQPAKTLGKDGEPKKGYLRGDTQTLVAILGLKVKNWILTSGTKVHAR